MTFKVRLETYHDAQGNEPIKKKRGWVPCNDAFYLMCALWEFNSEPNDMNIVKISLPEATPGYDFMEFVFKSIKATEGKFVAPEIIYRQSK